MCFSIHVSSFSLDFIPYSPFVLSGFHPIFVPFVLSGFHPLKFVQSFFCGLYSTASSRLFPADSIPYSPFILIGFHPLKFVPFISCGFHPRLLIPLNLPAFILLPASCYTPASLLSMAASSLEAECLQPRSRLRLAKSIPDGEKLY